MNVLPYPCKDAYDRVARVFTVFSVLVCVLFVYITVHLYTRLEFDLQK